MYDLLIQPIGRILRTLNRNNNYFNYLFINIYLTNNGVLNIRVKVTETIKSELNCEGLGLEQGTSCKLESNTNYNIKGVGGSPFYQKHF